MAAIFGKEEAARQEEFAQFGRGERKASLEDSYIYGRHGGISCFCKLGRPEDAEFLLEMIYSMKWILAGAGLAVTVLTPSRGSIKKREVNGSAPLGDMLSR